MGFTFQHKKDELISKYIIEGTVNDENFLLIVHLLKSIPNKETLGLEGSLRVYEGIREDQNIELMSKSTRIQSYSTVTNITICKTN